MVTKYIPNNCYNNVQIHIAYVYFIENFDLYIISHILWDISHILCAIILNTNKANFIIHLLQW